MVLFLKPDENPDCLNSDFGGHPFSISIIDVEDVDKALDVLLGVRKQIFLWY